jgi:hypothetical protein
MSHSALWVFQEKQECFMAYPEQTDKHEGGGDRQSTETALKACTEVSPLPAKVGTNAL